MIVLRVRSAVSAARSTSRIRLSALASCSRPLKMLRIAEMLPDDVIAELYEDPAYPGYTFMELRLAGYQAAPAPDQDAEYGEPIQPGAYNPDDLWASGTGY